MLLSVLLLVPISNVFCFSVNKYRCLYPTITNVFNSFNIHSVEDSDVDYSLMTRIDENGRILNKKRTPYTIATKSLGGLSELDDFYQGKYKVIWTVRGVAQKLVFRNRDSNPPPLKTSPFKFAGLSGFFLKLWLDGLPNAPKGYMSIELCQTEWWGSVDPKICIFINDIIKGPFYYKSTQYDDACLAVCKLSDIDLKKPLKVGVMVAPTNMLHA